MIYAPASPELPELVIYRLMDDAERFLLHLRDSEDKQRAMNRRSTINTATATVWVRGVDIGPNAANLRTLQAEPVQPC